MNYSLNTHRHRFACWAAGRAVARNFTKAEHVRDAIESTQLAPAVTGNKSFTDQEAFDIWHHQICQQIQEYWFKLPKGTVKESSFGRAAKVVAIYLKTTVGMRDENTHPMQAYLHPPIDRILLNNLRKELGYTIATLPKWTELDEEKYAEVLARIRAFINREHPKLADWTVEKWWAI